MKKSKIPNIVNTAFLSAIVVVSWVFFNVYRTVTKKTVSPVSEKVLSTIDPNLDTQTLSKLKERYYLNEDSIPTIEYKTETSSPSPTASSIPTATSSASPNASPSAIPNP